MRTKLNPKRYVAFKVSTDGNQNQWGYIDGLTVEECRDEKRFPTGLQHDGRGIAFTWGYALANDKAAL